VLHVLLKRAKIHHNFQPRCTSPFGGIFMNNPQLHPDHFGVEPNRIIHDCRHKLRPPENVDDFEIGLSEAVRAALDKAVELVRDLVNEIYSERK